MDEVVDAKIAQIIGAFQLAVAAIVTNCSFLDAAADSNVSIISI